MTALDPGNHRALGCDAAQSIGEALTRYRAAAWWDGAPRPHPWQDWQSRRRPS